MPLAVQWGPCAHATALPNVLPAVVSVFVIDQGSVTSEIAMPGLN